MSLLDYTAVELAAKIKAGETTATEAMEAVIAQIEKSEDELNCYVTFDKEKALAAAKKADEDIKAGKLTGPLAGVPFAIKDNMCTEGMLTTCSSKILGNFVPTYTADAVVRLENAGAVIIGKTNMDEFAMGSTTETSAFGATKNPRNPEHVPGGSSGGSAAAVAANECFYALGSDTGGSIRQPASFCGVVGLKPTYGAVSRYGLIAYASSLDQIGPITTSVEDAAIVFDAISAYDKMDSTSRGRQGAATVDTLNNSIKGMKIGIAKEYIEGVRDDVREAVMNAAKVYESLGAEIVYFDLPVLKYALPVYYILACAEASSNLGRYDGIRYGFKAEHYDDVNDMVKKTRSEGFGDEVKRRILLGTYVLSSGYYDAYYKKAQNLRGTIVNAFKEAFTKCSVILAPTVPMTAFENGNAISDPVETYLTDICTVPVNICGLPAVSVPCGFNAKGMPIGMQLIGDSFSEATILNVAHQYETAVPEAFRASDFGVKL